MSIFSAVQKVIDKAKYVGYQILSPKPEIICNTHRYGSDYGGWSVCDELLSEKSVVFSFGIGEDASFDTELIEKFNLKVHAFDPTPKSIEWVKEQNFPDNFIMHQYGLYSLDGVLVFFPPKNSNFVSHTIVAGQQDDKSGVSLPVKKISTILSELNVSEVDILKMDIEGSEYEVVEDIKVLDFRPKQILIEYHHRFNNIGFKKTANSIKLLQQMGYKLFSVSKNKEEFGFIYKQSI